MPLFGRHLYADVQRYSSFSACRKLIKEYLSGDVLIPLSDSDAVIIEDPKKWLKALRDFEVDHKKKIGGNQKSLPNILSVCTILVPRNISPEVLMTFSKKIISDVLGIEGLPYYVLTFTKGNGRYVRFVFSERPYHTDPFEEKVLSSRDFFKDPATNKLVSKTFPQAVCFRRKGDVIRTEIVHFESRKKSITRFANKGLFNAFISGIKMFCKDFFNSYCHSDAPEEVNNGALTLRIDGNHFRSHFMRAKIKAFNYAFIKAEKAINEFIYACDMAGVQAKGRIANLVQKLRGFQENLKGSLYLGRRRFSFSINPNNKDFTQYTESLDVINDVIRNDIEMISRKIFAL